MCALTKYLVGDRVCAQCAAYADDDCGEEGEDDDHDDVDDDHGGQGEVVQNLK